MGNRTKQDYLWAGNLLVESPFVILNPVSEKRSFKKNPLYLRDTKNPNWLYLYYTRSAIGVNELRDLTVKDWKNQIVYSSKNVNIPGPQVFQPLINF